MPTYLFECNSCKHQFEEFQDLSEPFPPCEKCQLSTRRLIAGTPGVKVRLYGKELFNKLQAEGHEMQRQASHNENLLANLVGEEKYNNNLSAAASVASALKDD